MLRSLLKHINSGLSIPHDLFAPVGLCLLLCLENIKLVLEGILLAHSIMFFALELLFRLASLQVGILPPFAIFSHTFSIELGVFELRFELAELSNIFVGLNPQGFHL